MFGYARAAEMATCDGIIDDTWRFYCISDEVQQQLLGRKTWLGHKREWRNIWLTLQHKWPNLIILAAAVAAWKSYQYYRTKQLRKRIKENLNALRHACQRENEGGALLHNIENFSNFMALVNMGTAFNLRANQVFDAETGAFLSCAQICQEVSMPKTRESILYYLTNARASFSSFMSALISPSLALFSFFLLSENEAEIKLAHTVEKLQKIEVLPDLENGGGFLLKRALKSLYGTNWKTEFVAMEPDVLRVHVLKKLPQISVRVFVTFAGEERTSEEIARAMLLYA